MLHMQDSTFCSVLIWQDCALIFVQNCTNLFAYFVAVCVFKNYMQMKFFGQIFSKFSEYLFYYFYDYRKK